MADNFTTAPGTGGETFASDDIGGVQYPRFKLTLGADGINGGDVSTANPMPTTALTDTQLRALPVAISGALTDAQLRASAVPVSLSATTVTNTVAVSGPLTDTQLRATAVPVSLASTTITGSVAVTGPLTDTQLRATAVPVSVASLANAQGSTTTGQTGPLVLGAVTTAAPTYTTGQSSPLSLDTAGGLRVAAHPVTQSGTWNVTVNAAIAAGTNAIGDVGIQYRANATGAATVANVLCPATPAAQSVKATAGRLLLVALTNTNAAARWLKVWNTASGGVTLGTTAALTEIAIPPNQTINLAFDGGLGFGTAITIAITGGAGLTNNAAVTAGDVTGFVGFA